MKRIFIISCVIIAIVAIILVANQKNNTNESAKDEGSSLISEHIKSANGQLIDVREPDEYKESHADGAINIPLSEIEKGNYQEIESTRPIYVYCRSGRRSALAKIALEKAGYENIVDIGGIDRWQNDGNKVCSSSLPACS